jgi:hypothetical protein
MYILTTQFFDEPLIVGDVSLAYSPDFLGGEPSMYK